MAASLIAVARAHAFILARPWALVLGRLLVLETVSLAISAVTSAVMIVGTGPASPADVLAGVILVGVVAVPLCLALGALVARELEATLVLIGIAGIQLTAGSDSDISRLLPFRSAGQLLDASVSASAGFWPRLAASVAYAAVMLTIAWLAWLRRVAIRGARGVVRPDDQAERLIDLCSR